MSVDQRRRLLAFGFIVIFLTVTGWLTLRVLRPDPMTVGSSLEPITIIGPSGAELLEGTNSGALVLIFFHSECTYCLLEFDDLNAHLDELGTTAMVLLTAQDSLPDQLIAERWPRLVNARQVKWARVDADEFRSRFGTLLTPANFVFNAGGELVWKSVGKPPWERLAKAIQAAQTGVAL